MDKVVVSTEKRGAWTITVNKWFDKSVDDGLIVRDIPVDAVGGQVGTYLLKFMTCSKNQGAT